MVVDGDSRVLLTALAGIDSLGPRVMVPGHGALPAPPTALLARTREYFTGLQSDMRAAVEKGIPMQRAMAQLPPADPERPVSLNSRKRRNAVRVYLEEERAYMGLESSAVRRGARAADRSVPRHGLRHRAAGEQRGSSDRSAPGDRVHRHPRRLAARAIRQPHRCPHRGGHLSEGPSPGSGLSSYRDAPRQSQAGCRPSFSTGRATPGSSDGWASPSTGRWSSTARARPTTSTPRSSPGSSPDSATRRSMCWMAATSSGCSSTGRWISATPRSE